MIIFFLKKSKLKKINKINFLLKKKMWFVMYIIVRFLVYFISFVVNFI